MSHDPSSNADAVLEEAVEAAWQEAHAALNRARKSFQASYEEIVSEWHAKKRAAYGAYRQDRRLSANDDDDYGVGGRNDAEVQGKSHQSGA